MTSEVMAGSRGAAHHVHMRYVVTLIWIAFTVFSLVVVANHGYTGFISLAVREPWGMQMLLDLAIALSLFGTWLVRDARERGLVAWPWLVGMLLLGSIAALPYLLWRRRGA